MTSRKPDRKQVRKRARMRKRSKEHKEKKRKKIKLINNMTLLCFAVSLKHISIHLLSISKQKTET